MKLINITFIPDEIKNTISRSNSKSFALASGILWAICILITTLISSYTGYATDFLKVVSSIYPGYTITPLGSIIGAVYAFIDMFIGTYILIWLYNYTEEDVIDYSFFHPLF